MPSNIRVRILFPKAYVEYIQRDLDLVIRSLADHMYGTYAKGKTEGLYNITNINALQRKIIVEGLESLGCDVLTESKGKDTVFYIDFTHSILIKDQLDEE